MAGVLLAKSSCTPNAPKDAETLPGHLELVLRVARTLLAARGAAVLEMLGLDAERWAPVLKHALLPAAVLHDLGKANTQFQRLVRGHRLTQAYPHEVLSLLILHRQPALDAWLFAGRPAVARGLALRAVAGHHLRFTAETSLQARASGQLTVYLLLDHPDVHAALRRANSLLGLADPPALNALELNLAEDEAWPLARYLRNALAGDWGHGDVVRCAGAVLALLVAADICASAVVRGGRDPAAWAQEVLAECPNGEALARVVAQGLKGRPLRPFQEHVAAASSRLTLLTAGCGTGKTVAAYCWAARRAAGRRLFFCYPTTGTATEGFTKYAFPEFAALVHSRAAYDLTELRIVPDDDASAVEQAWTGLMPWGAALSVGTVDAVLGLLQHARTSLTAFPAFAGAAFVFDEVHLYDDRLFRTLLRFLAACRNAPALLMTASLQPDRRAALERVAQVLGEPLTIIPGPRDLETLPRYLLRQAEAGTAMAAVEQALRSSGRVLWIANTVERALALAQMAAKRGWPVEVYHSRFRYRDRLARHRAIVDAFRSDSRCGAVLAVTTQVCEVSLDISADVLVSELAPPPALIQRLGRLNRWALPGADAEPAPAFILEPPNAAPYTPYSSEELDHGRRWLAAVADRPVSQQDLRDAFERLAPTSPLCPATDVAWLDRMLDCRPQTLREPSTTIEVLREEDLPACTDRAHAIGYAIPMLLSSVSQKVGGWPRRFGIPVAPAGSIGYDVRWGGRWSRKNGGG